MEPWADTSCVNLKPIWQYVIICYDVMYPTFIIANENLLKKPDSLDISQVFKPREAKFYDSTTNVITFLQNSYKTPCKIMFVTLFCILAHSFSWFVTILYIIIIVLWGVGGDYVGLWCVVTYYWIDIKCMFHRINNVSMEVTWKYI